MARRASRKDLTIDLGTVLAIPVGDSLWALAQVLRPGTAFYLAITGETFPDPLHVEAIKQGKFVLFSWTNDAEVYNGAWKNLGVAPLPSATPQFPEYKLWSSDDMSVWSFDDHWLRPFDGSRDTYLNYKTVRSPKLVERGVRAFHGLTEWLPRLDKMRQP
jgi:hypothetical protein